MSWKKVKLSELLSQLKIIVQIDNNKEYKLVTVSSKGTIRQREIVKGLEIKGEKAFEAKRGKFIYSRLSVHNGAFGIVPPELDGALLTSEMPIFEISDKILPEFLIYSLQLPTFKFQLEQLTKGVGRTRVKEVNFLSLIIDLPNISDQANIIKSLIKAEQHSELISTELTHQLTLVKKLRQQLLQDAVQGKLVEQNKKDESASELLKKIKAEKQKLRKGNVTEPFSENSIPYNIPNNWIWCKFGEVIQMARGKFSIRPRNDPSYFGGVYPFIQIGSLDEKGSIINEAKQTLNEKGIKVSKKFPKNTIAIAIVGGTIGNLGVLGREMYFTDSIIGILPSQYYNQDYILNYLRYKQPEIKSEAYQMAGQPNIKIPTLENLLFPMPPLAEQNRIVQKLDELMQYCNELEGSIKQSESQNEKLLQQVLREALRKEEVEV
jgi:type I restriction enzyme S subunit